MTMFEKSQIHLAVDFFEKNRQLLFKEVGPKLERLLFDAYVDLNQVSKAAEFYKTASNQTFKPKDSRAGNIDRDIDHLRHVTFLSEMAEKRIERNLGKAEIGQQERPWLIESGS